MRDNGLGSWTRRRARMTPAKAALVQDGQRDDVRRAAPRQHPAGPRAARPRSRPRRPGRLPRAQLRRAGRGDVRHGAARRGLRAGQHPAGAARARPHPRRQRRAAAARRGRASRGPVRRPRSAGPGRRSRSTRSPGGQGRGLDALDGRRRRRDRRAGRARRPLHDPVHLRHQRPAEGRDAHPRQRRLERLQPARRHRPHERGDRPGHRAPVPHRGAEPGAVPDHPQGRHRARRGQVRPRRAPST